MGCHCCQPESLTSVDSGSGEAGSPVAAFSDPPDHLTGVPLLRWYDERNEPAIAEGGYAWMNTVEGASRATIDRTRRAFETARAALGPGATPRQIADLLRTTVRGAMAGDNQTGEGGTGAGPLVTGLVHDATGSYALAFWMAIGWCLISIVAVWLAAPRKVRAVAGRVPRLAAQVR